MLTLICAGGSGARILESLIHLCVAGLGPPKLRAFVVDPDATNGNLDVTKKLVERYILCRETFANKEFFTTELDLIQPGTELITWIPVNRQQKFENVLNYHQLTPEQKDVVRLFFTASELDMDMDVGFRGHPALGAAALSLLPVYQKHPAEAFWNKVTGQLQHDVLAGEARVVIAGSVFGGTGASAIHPLVRYLRSAMNDKANAHKLKVAAVALVPYFKFSAADSATGQIPKDEVTALSEHFALAAKSAASYYDHLYRTRDWDFDAMYWVGDDTPVTVKYSKGGSPQQNPAHFVELLGALACLEFALNPPSQRSCWYSGPHALDSATSGNLISWSDLPIAEQSREHAQRKLHAFHLAAVAHLGFFHRLFQDSRLEAKPWCVPWYNDRFGPGSGSLTSKSSRDQLEALRTYLTLNYFPWWMQVHTVEGSGRVRLFNPAVWRDGPDNLSTNRLDNLRYPDNNAHSYDCVDRLFTQMVKAGPKSSDEGSPPSRYFSILTNAATQLVEQEDKVEPGR